MERRNFFGAMTAAGVGAAAPATAANNGAQIAIDTAVTKSGLGKKIPINRERAYEVMDELKIDGLIALRPHNVYYLTNTVTTLTAFRAEFPSFGVFPRDPKQSSFLLSSTGNTWETENGDRDVPPVIAFSGASNWQDYIDATPEKLKIRPKSAGESRRMTPVRAGVELTAREKGWDHAQHTYIPLSAPTPAWAIVDALKQAGITKGRIAVDDMRIAYLLDMIGYDAVTIIPGDNIFRRIRHVKTDYEVSMLRAAQSITQGAMVAAAHALERGMTYDEFRHRFFAEAAARGGEASFILLGVTQGLLPDGVVKEGRTYLMDGSAGFKMYQGDFARTIAVGEPSKEQMKYFKAQQTGREAAFAMIKAGVPFQKVEQVAREAIVKSGMPTEAAITSLHSVGLQHGDDPGRGDVAFSAPAVLTLEENMTVTLDLPFHEIGGPAGHNEDLLRITKTGFEILNDPREPMIIV